MLIEVSDGSRAGEARRLVAALTEELRMDETRRGLAALAVTEMATNLAKHATAGHILVQRLQRNGGVGVRLISVDKGPGIRDVPRALSDGYSTAGSLGTGLGAIRRASDAFDLYTVPDSGTLILADFWAGEQTQGPSSCAMEVGVVSEPITGEDVCGDGWGIRGSQRSLLAMVVDGLGHGVLAAEAAREAERILAATREQNLRDIVGDTHAALLKTRGAAFGLARVDLERRLLSFAGVGNVGASVVAPGSSRSFASQYGILGQQIQKVQEFTLPWEDTSILVMHSDGLGTRWDLNRYPGIWGRHPSLIAALLHRDFARGRDDVTVLVAKAVPVIPN